jgi:hypothetical protein
LSYTFVQQVENSSASGSASFAAPALTVGTGGHLLAITTICSSGDFAALSLSGGGNTYLAATSQAGNGLTLGLFYVQGAASGSTTVTATLSSGASLAAIYVAEYSGIATTAALLGVNSTATTGSGSTGANFLNTGNVSGVTAASLLFGFCADTNPNTTACTAGTLPTAFNGRTAVWGTYSGGTAINVPEDAEITSNVAVTYGVSSGNSFDIILAVAAAFAYPPAGGSPILMGQACL